MGPEGNAVGLPCIPSHTGLVVNMFLWLWGSYGGFKFNVSKSIVHQFSWRTPLKVRGVLPISFRTGTEPQTDLVDEGDGPQLELILKINVLSKETPEPPADTLHHCLRWIIRSIT